MCRGKATSTAFDRLTIRRAQLSAGPHRLQWDGRDDDGRSVATGIYFYRLTTPTRSVARKLLLIR